MAKTRTITVTLNADLSVTMKLTASTDYGYAKENVYTGEIDGIRIEAKKSPFNALYPWSATVSDKLGRASKGQMGIFFKGCNSSTQLESYDMKTVVMNALLIVRNVRAFLAAAE